MDISNKFKVGILYTALGKYSNVIIQLFVTAVLSRILWCCSGCQCVFSILSDVGRFGNRTCNCTK